MGVSLQGMLGRLDTLALPPATQTLYHRNGTLQQMQYIDQDISVVTHRSCLLVLLHNIGCHSCSVKMHAVAVLL